MSFLVALTHNNTYKAVLIYLAVQAGQHHLSMPSKTVPNQFCKNKKDDLTQLSLSIGLGTKTWVRLDKHCGLC